MRLRRHPVDGGAAGVPARGRSVGQGDARILAKDPAVAQSYLGL